MSSSLRRFFPVLLILGFAFLFGCAELGLGAEVTPEEEDPFSARLESLNTRIAMADSHSSVTSLTAEVEALEDEIEASGEYPDHLILTDAQLLTMEVIDASLILMEESDKIATSGVDCSRDYGSLENTLDMNSTKKTATQKINSYLSKYPDSNADSLIAALDNADVDGMYLFTEIVAQEQAYQCLETESPVQAYTTPLTEEEAVNLVVNEVVGTDDYLVYSVGQPLEAGTVVSVMDPSGELTNRTMDTQTWFFMLDDDPLASFAHPVKFVYVDVATADYSVSDEMFNPIIDGIHYWPDLEDRTDPEWVVYPEDPVFDLNETVSLSSIETYYDGRLYVYPLAIANVPDGTECDKIDCCNGVGKDKALIINGNDQDLFHTDTANMYDFVKNEMGLSAGDITYLTAKDGVPESDGITTMESYKKAIENLAKDSECCDRIFIYMTGHGTNVTYWEFKEKATGKLVRFNRAAAIKLNRSKWEYAGRAYAYHIMDMNPYKEKKKADGSTVTQGSKKGGDVWAEDVAALLDKIKSCYVTVMYDSCHSGYAAPWLAGKGRTIMTTSNKGSSYAYPRGKDGKTAGGIWNTLWIMAHNTFKDEADKNNDGNVDHQEAYDYANKYAPGVVKAHTGKKQEGTITPPQPPCECCHVLCNEKTDYLCKVLEGEKKPQCDPQCEKIGDYCGPTTATGLPPEEDGGVTVGGGGEVPPDDGEPPETPPTEPEEAVCGDGNITGGEQCDHGSYNTNKCPEGKYCRDCACRDLETTVVCGDGKISSPMEDCDGGNVLYNICPEGQRCHICQCIGETATCGDGLITPPEECDHGNSYTAQCPSGLTCYSCSCIPPGEVPEEQTHLECVDQACVTVPGSGTDQCSSSADCEEGPECGNGEVEAGEECEDQSDCSGDDLCIGCQCISPAPYCGDGEVNGDEECDPNASPDGCSEGEACRGDCTCTGPPVLDCDAICGYAPGAQNFGGGYATEAECTAAVDAYYGEPASCTTLCKYSFIYGSSNVAGTSTCCCGMKKEFECSADCTTCPDPVTVCNENEPSWYAG